MLTSDLVRARVRKGYVEPSYIQPADARFLELASSMVESFERHVGQPRRLLDAELKDVLGTGTAFMLHRGLAKLLRDRCEFDTEAQVAPAELRARVFAEAAASYRDPEKLRFERDSVKRAVCESFELVEDDFERNLYADLRDEQVLKEFKKCEPEWLLRRYNVALAQAVVLRASSLQIKVRGETPARYRELFRRMKFFRLLHTVEVEEPGSYSIILDGPLSLFSSSQRYGIQMALFLPTLLHASEWSLEAEVLWGIKRKRVKFRLDEKAGLKPIGHSTGQWIPEEVAWFSEQFAKLKSDWDLSADTELIELGGQGVLIPDHVFVHRPSGFTVHMEILGFWRRGAVESRLKLLRDHGPGNMILALSKELKVDEEELPKFAGEVYVFRSTPVARDVLKLLGSMIDGPRGED